jgi:hypothetical protein
MAKMVEGIKKKRNWKTPRKSRYEIVDKVQYGATGLGD